VTRLQRVCEDHILRWRELVKLENISDEFCKFLRDSKDPAWAIIFKASDCLCSVEQAPSDVAGNTMGAAAKGDDEPVSSEVRRHSNFENVSRLLGAELMIETTLAQKHLRQSMNAFHYFCGVNNVNGYIPYLMEMMPRMREATLRLLSKIPIPYKMEIVSPHLITGVARTLELEIAAFDVDRKDQVRRLICLLIFSFEAVLSSTSMVYGDLCPPFSQVALGRFRVRRPLLWIKWMLWTSHLFSLGKFSSEVDHGKDLWTTYWAPWAKGKGGKSSQTKKPWHYDKVSIQDGKIANFRPHFPRKVAFKCLMALTLY
jgi:hypothetical protein